MPAPLEIVVTNAGRAAIINAQNNGTAPVTIAQIGLSATAVTPLPTAVALAGEIKRIAAIAGEVVADDTIHVTLTDESADAYTLRSLALYLADGTLFAIYGQAGPVLEKTAQSIAALSIDVIFADIAAAALTFGNANFTNPPATTERQGVVELATVAEAQAGIDALRALTPAAAKAAVLGWLLAQDGSGSGLDADLLDGQDGGYYSNIPARLGFSPVQQGTGVGQSGNLIKIGWSGTRIKATVDTFDQGNIVTDAWLASGGLSITGYTMYRGSYNLWGPDNDGAGSGLDADLLDGSDGSFYTNIPARLGYNPVQQGGGTGQGGNKVYIGWSGTYMKLQVDSVDLGYIMTNGLLNGGTFPIHGATVGRAGYALWGPDNDGAGSGLDADLLDGQDGSYYSNITARLGYSPVNKAGDTMSGALTLPTLVVAGAAGTNGLSGGTGDGASYSLYNLTMNIWWGLGIKTYDGSVNGFYDARAGRWDVKAGYRINGVDVWHPGNDGSGSGLDADLLDGFQASDFVRHVNFTKATNYEILPDGRILQWGFADALPTRSTTTITFPIAFPNAALQMLASLGTSLTLSENRVGCGAACISNTQGNIALPANFGGTIGVAWLAIGH